MSPDLKLGGPNRKRTLLELIHAKLKKLFTGVFRPFPTDAGRPATLPIGAFPSFRPWPKRAKAITKLVQRLARFAATLGHMVQAYYLLATAALAEIIGFSAWHYPVVNGLGKALGGVLCILFFILRYFGAEEPQDKPPQTAPERVRPKRRESKLVPF